MVGSATPFFAFAPALTLRSGLPCTPAEAGLVWPRNRVRDRPEMSEDLLTFKEMCAKFDVTPRTLRYYEYIELLSPIRDGRARYYTPREVARMTLIMRGRPLGFLVGRNAPVA